MSLNKLALLLTVVLAVGCTDDNSASKRKRTGKVKRGHSAPLVVLGTGGLFQTRSTAADDTETTADDGETTAEDTGVEAPTDDDAVVATEDTTTAVDTSDVFGMYTLHVASGSNYAAQAAAWRVSAPSSAALMDAMAAQPLALWLGDWTTDVTGTVDDAITAAGATELRTFVGYNIPNRDCGAWSAGGASDATAYAAFIANLAAGIDGRATIVILEPDALPLTVCLSSTQADERFAMMAAAVVTLTAAGASVYLDAGDSNWIGATEMASRLKKAGVYNAAGFSLNVSHTEYESKEIEFAEEIRAILGDTVHYVIDTSRSGLGPTVDNEWCNPLGRAVGTLPTTVTGVDGLDAYLFVKPPGESDGSCNGGPSAGSFWGEYALELADLSTTL